MPELPEVETVRRGLEAAMLRNTFVKVIQNRHDLRFPFPENFAKRLKGRRIEKLERRAKYLRAYMDDGWVLVMHLGMSGRFTITEPGERTAEPLPHDHVIFRMSNDSKICYNDPRRFGYMELIEVDRLGKHRFFCKLGPEPLGNEFSADVLLERASGRRTAIKTFLLDQKVVVGLGNIYVCEALYRSGISPLTEAGSLEVVKASKLVAHIKDILIEAIASGGSSLKDYRHTDGSLGYFQHGFAVYDREGLPCPHCASKVSRMVQAGRATFYCQRCQV
jgi:formamidopyrimidine-DNA glycosylase